MHQSTEIMHHHCTSNLAAAFTRKLYNNQPASDITLRFQGETVYTVQGLLEEASDVFRAAFNGKFANSVTKQYVIEDHPKEVVYAMIKHIHGFELPARREVEFYTGVYLIGNEYKIRALQVAATERLKFLMSRLFDKDMVAFAYLFESIVSLYEENELCDWPCGRFRETAPYTLIATTARFCIKKQPAYVFERCNPPSNQRLPVQRYRNFTKMISRFWNDTNYIKRGYEWNSCFTNHLGTYNDHT